MKFNKKWFGLFLFVSIWMIVNLTPTEASNSDNNSITNGNQPSRFTLLCLLQQQFTFPVKNGDLTVHCIRNQTALNRLLSNMRRQKLLTSNEEINATKNKASRLLERDLFVSICFLNCTKGRPSPRTRYLSEFVKEPTNVNVGCNDATNLKCGENRQFYCGCKVPEGSTSCNVLDKLKASSIKKVNGGSTTDPKHWPWHAFISYKGVLCGGTLIHPRYVLTTAHCLSGSTKNESNSDVVALGLANISNPTDPNVQYRGILRFQIHQNFSFNAKTKFYDNDIALIKLRKHVNITGKAVGTLCLPGNRRSRLDDECYVTGFGKTAVATVSLTLQAAAVSVNRFSSCNPLYNNNLDSKQHICAGNNGSRADTCKGDSGGPLACKRRGSSCCQWYLAGLTGYGRVPCGQGIPSVYIRIYYYQRWIQTTLNAMTK